MSYAKYMRKKNVKCKGLYQTFFQTLEGSDSSRAATELLKWLDKMPKNQWSEAFQSINFSYSSRKAWSTLNNVTGRSLHSSLQCPVSSGAIESHLVKNGRYEKVNHKSSRLILKEVSELWRDPRTNPVNVSRFYF